MVHDLLDWHTLAAEQDEAGSADQLAVLSLYVSAAIVITGHLKAQSARTPIECQPHA